MGPAVQDPFEVHAAQVWRFLTSYELIVAHNAAFDLRFINREMTLAGLSTAHPAYLLHHERYRALGIGGSAALSAVCSHIKLARSGQLHGAIEDAWLAMQVYLWLHGCPFQRQITSFASSNSVQLPSRGIGRLAYFTMLAPGNVIPRGRCADMMPPCRRSTCRTTLDANDPASSNYSLT